jgi:hypothetical protein
VHAICAGLGTDWPCNSPNPPATCGNTFGGSGGEAGAGTGGGGGGDASAAAVASPPPPAAAAAAPPPPPAGQESRGRSDVPEKTTAPGVLEVCVEID